jgi:hypothetical protein
VQKNSFSGHVGQMYEVSALMKIGMDMLLLEHLAVLIIHALLF